MINSFREENFFLSNFYLCPITYNGLRYTNAESAFQAQKTLSRDDRIRFATLDPASAKKFGRQIALRKDWEDIKLKEMKKILIAKFSQNLDLAKKLLDTKDEYLEEGNTWGDKFWGTVNGVGENHLGKILMEIRQQLHENY